MKKESIQVDEKNVYSLSVLLNNTALMKSVFGKTGLINIKTNEIVGSFDDFHTIYSESSKFYFQEKHVEDVISDSNRSYSKNNLHVRIYDAIGEKTVVDDFIVVSKIGSYYSLVILQDPKTKKYRLFNEEKYRSEKNLYDTEFDEINLLYSSYGEYFLSLCKDGKKALYSSEKGLVTSYEYDDIQRIDDVTVFTKDNNKFFTCLIDSNDKMFTSPLYKDVKSAGKNLIYCKSDLMIYIYYVQKMICKLLFSTSLCDEIECVREITDSGYRFPQEYIFVGKNNNKYGVLSGVVNKASDREVPCQYLTAMTYNGIKYSGGNFFLEDGEKIGLFVGDSKKKHTINAYYDNIVPIGGTKYYELFYGDRCDIYNIEASNTVVRDCKIIKNISNTVIYEKNCKKGIFSVKSSSHYFLSKLYDDIEYLGCDYFLVTENGKKGIIYGTQLLIEPNYESIEVNGYHDCKDLNVLEYADTLYFAMKKSDWLYDLAMFKKKKYSWEENKLEYLDVQKYNDIQLFNLIMVFRDNKNTYIYSYTGKLLKTYPADVEIREENGLYVVDGIYYLCKGEKLEVAPVEDCTLYATAYESECGTVVVNSYDKNKHDEMCREIEECGEEEFDDVLMKIYRENPQIQKKYTERIPKSKRIN